MLKYKVGDCVKVRDDLKENYIDFPFVNLDMLAYAGKILKVLEIVGVGYTSMYILEYPDGKRSPYMWSDYMLDLTYDDSKKSTVDVLESWKLRLFEETQELAVKLHKLQDFMGSDTFIDLDRTRKDLFYDQYEYMMRYLQTLGKILEVENIKFEHKKETE